MIYDSIDIIPAKIFFKISDTGNLKLLVTDESVYDDNKLSLIWKNIEDENISLDNTNSIQKVVDVTKKIESLYAKFEAIKLAVYYLKKKIDNELIDLLLSYGYKFKWNEKEYSLENKLQYQKDLDKIERESQTIYDKIERLQQKLPKPKENKDKKIPFDEVILGYGVITEAGFIDSNKITLTQYYALIKIGNEKIKSIEKSIQKSKKR